MAGFKLEAELAKQLKLGFKKRRSGPMFCAILKMKIDEVQQHKQIARY
jgi:hypothetical protein